MRELEGVMAFERGIDGFIKHIRSVLYERANVRLSQHATPQNLATLFLQQGKCPLQLRFVVLAVDHDQSLGRLSWLDQNGCDHVCCYVNESFHCVVRKRNGKWSEQKHKVDDLCARRLLDLLAA